jgi:hypothetical protein
MKLCPLNEGHILERLQLSKLVPSAVLKKPKYASEKSITHDRE